VRRRDHLDRLPAAEEAGDLVDGPHGRGQPDALGGRLEQLVEPLQRQREVRPAFGARHRVHLVDDHGVDAAQRLACLRGQDQEQRLGRGDQDVGRSRAEPSALGGRGVAGAHADGDVGLGGAQPLRGVADAGERRPQVALDVDGQRLERGHVHNPATPAGVGRGAADRQPVQRPQESRQRLARPGRRDHQRVAPGTDRLPGPDLSRGRRGERRAEPLARRGGEAPEDRRGVGCHDLHSTRPHRQHASAALPAPSPAFPSAAALGKAGEHSVTGRSGSGGAARMQVRVSPASARMGVHLRRGTR
jgi:hypothetical protein